MSAFTNEQAKRAWSFAEEEEQRRECALIFEKNRSKRYKACSDLEILLNEIPALMQVRSKKERLNLERKMRPGSAWCG